MADEEPTLAFLTEALPACTIDVDYEQWLQTTGGTEPITFEVEGGEFPSGLGLSSEGLVYGIPLEGATDSTVFITVSDADSEHQTQAFDIEVRKGKSADESETA